MQRCNFWFIIAGLMSVWLLAGSTRADDAKAQPDKRPRLVAQLGHSGQVTSVAFSPDGKQVLTGSDDKTARLWDARSAKLLRTFTGHTDGVNSVAFSPDGRFVLTGGDDNMARLWDAASGKEVRVFKGHEKSVESVAFSPDGKQVLTGSKDNTARLWDARSGKELRTFVHTESITSVAFSPDGKQVLTGNWDMTARLWGIQSGKVLRTFMGHASAVNSVAFSPDGKQVLTGSWDHTARLWDSLSGKLLRTLGQQVRKGKLVLTVAGHFDSVTSVAFSPDGKWVLTGSRDHRALLWDISRGKEVRAFTGHAEEVRSVAFSPDGKQALTGGGQVQPVRLWQIETGKSLRSLPGRPSFVTSMVFNPDKKILATGNQDQTVKTWKIENAIAFQRLKGHEAFVNFIALTPEGTILASASWDRAIRLWDVGTGKELRTLKGHTDRVYSVAFSPDGRTLASGSVDQTIRLWDVRTGKELRILKGHSETVDPISFSPDGKTLASGGYDSTIRLWEVGTGNELRILRGHSGALYSVAFSPDGKTLASCGGDGAIRLWDVGTGLEHEKLQGHSSWVWLVAFSPDGKILASSGGDQTVKLWDVRSGKLLQTLEGHGSEVTTVAFNSDGKILLSGSKDGTIKLWSVAEKAPRELCTVVSFSDGTWAVVDADGRFDASNGGDVEGLHWVVGMEPIALKQLKQRYYDPGLLAKYMGFNKQPLRKVEKLGEIKLHPEATVAEIKPGDKKLTLNLTNRGGGIGRVQVFVNGKELHPDARGPKPDSDAQQATLDVDLDCPFVIPGKPNQITVVTWNADGYLSSRGLKRVWTPAGKADPNPPELYVIVCGVSEYAEPKLNLRFAAKDAEDMAHALELAGKRLFGADKVHLTLLSTGNNPKAHKPTKENIRNAFESVRKAKPTDVLVVYLAGHGVALKQGDDEYCYLTSDACSTDTTALADPPVLASWTVTSSELVDWINKIPASKQVMLLDTCAAGAAAAKLMEHRDLPGDQVRALDRLKDRTGFHVLMGCAADRKSYEASQYSQGLLTYSLLQGMAGAKLREGEYVDVSGLFQYAADEVPQLARGIGGVQKPLVMAPHGDSFDIGRLVEADRKALPLAKPKPLILRPQLSNVEDGDDNLKLASLVGKRLADNSFKTPRGTAVTTVFVDAEELAGAVRPVGKYTIDGKNVRVRLVLKQDGKTLKKVTVDGSTDDLLGLAGKLAEAIEQAVKKP